MRRVPSREPGRCSGPRDRPHQPCRTYRPGLGRHRKANVVVVVPAAMPDGGHVPPPRLYTRRRTRGRDELCIPTWCDTAHTVRVGYPPARRFREYASSQRVRGVGSLLSWRRCRATLNWLGSRPTPRRSMRRLLRFDRRRVHRASGALIGHGMPSCEIAARQPGGECSPGTRR